MWSFFVSILEIFFFVYCLVYTIHFMLFDADLALIFAEKFGKNIGYLQGKVVWITGASSGIGEALAKSLTRHGVKVVLSARREHELERVKAQCLLLSKLEPKDILVLPMDITLTDRHADHFSKVITHFGSLDILVNNAGRSQRAIWEDIDIDVDRQLFELNVFGPIALTRMAVKYFSARGGGHVAIVSSLAGVVPAPYSASYTGSKHSLHGYYGSLALEKLNKNIKVSILCPGPTFSNFLENSFTDKPDETFGQSVTPTDRRMTAERCADLCGIALANDIREAWISQSPGLIIAYFSVYFPVSFAIVVKYFGPKLFMKVRDSRDSMAPTTT